MATQLLKYPIDKRIEVNTDYLKIEVVKFGAPGISESKASKANPFSFSSYDYSKEIPLGTIILPIPENLVDINTGNWTGDSINSLELAAIQGAGDIIDSGQLGDGRGVGERVGDVGNTFQDVLQRYLGALDQQTRDKLVQGGVASILSLGGSNVSASSIINRATGQILNPNLELLYNGPALRSFTYNFTFSPRSRSESLVVKGIINTFKKRMAPKSLRSSAGSSGIFIGSPDVFKLKFMNGNEKHPFLYSLKTCALRQCQINYDATGNNATYEDGTPVKMVMQLTFQELNPVYDSDYDMNNLPGADEGVGF